MSVVDEKELDMLRGAVDKAQRRQGRAKLEDPSTKKIIGIVEQFISKQGLICYGGTAINNILPVGAQFYDKNTEFPDYDFYSPNALEDAELLANVYHNAGFSEVEAKAGVHHGTYKVYVNYIPVADITSLPKRLFHQLRKSALTVNNIKYAPPDFLRMSMYLELSRPDGDVSRWEKVLKRLTLLNRFYPMKKPRCSKSRLLRKFEGSTEKGRAISRVILTKAAELGMVFFGGVATAKLTGNKVSLSDPDFDLISPSAALESQQIVVALKTANLGEVSSKRRPGVWEIVPVHYEISVGKDIVAVVYQSLACHNYNFVYNQGSEMRIATFDTMLSLWLAFLYDSRYSEYRQRIYCMAQSLFYLQKRSRLKKRGTLKRFGPTCIGEQPTLESVRADKAMKYEELRDDKSSAEWRSWFLNYKPTGKKKTPSTPRKNKTKKRKSRRKKQ